LFKVRLVGAFGGYSEYPWSPGQAGDAIEFTIETSERFDIFLGTIGKPGMRSSEKSSGRGGEGGKNHLGGKYNGGVGGSAGKGKYSTAGGGGGAASVLKVDGKTYVAAGGAGAGGSNNCMVLADQPGRTPELGLKTGTTTSPVGRSSSIDNGGGGGGGGGYSFGFGGSISDRVKQTTSPVCRGAYGFGGRAGTSFDGDVKPHSNVTEDLEYDLGGMIEISYEDPNFPGEPDPAWDSSHEWEISSSSLKSNVVETDAGQAEFQTCLMKNGDFVALPLALIIEGADNYLDTQIVESSDSECGLSQVEIGGMPPGLYSYRVVLDLSDGHVIGSRRGTLLILSKSGGTFENKVRPRVQGSLKLGSTLTASVGRWEPAGQTSLQWLRNGLPIKGATKTKYTVQSQDLKSRITFQVTVFKVGFLSVVDRAPALGANGATIAGQGVFMVGFEAKPGIYKSNSNNPKCIWKRLSSFDGASDSVIGTGGGAGQQLVAISKFDVGFSTQNCGAWQPAN
jgi:hypothetical protein